MITALEEETESDVPVVLLYESEIGKPGSEIYQGAMVYHAKALVEDLN